MQGTQKPQSYARITRQVAFQAIQNTSRRDSPRITGTQSTSITIQTLPLKKSEYVDYLIYDKLPYTVNKYSFKYDGSVHANWSRNLTYLYQKTNIPIAKIEEYIEPLTEHIETMKHWDVKNTLDTFTFMFKVSFFDQLDSLTKNKEQVISLRNKFMNNINDKLHEIPLQEKNAISYIYLLKSILAQINYDKNISSISEKLLDQIYFSLMKMEEPLSSYHYKEILQTITEIGNRIHKYVPMFKLLIYKHLDSMAKTEINSSNELNFAVYLSGISNLIIKNFPIEGENKNNLIQLIHKIKFTKDIDMAVLGLKSITMLLDKEKILLTAVENKINECVNFIQDRNLGLHQMSIVLVSVSKYANSLNILPDNLKAIIDKYLVILVKNKDFLSFESLQLLLKTLRNLIPFDYPISTILEKIAEVIDKNKIDFSNSSPKEIHRCIADLTKILICTKKQVKDNLAIKFINFFNLLTPKYLATILDTPLNETINNFVTLSTLIDVGYLANIHMRKTFNSLLSKIDKEIGSLTQKQAINFFRVICLNHNLFMLTDEKIIEYANKLLELAANKTQMKDSVQTESSILWCILVFYETNYEKFSKTLLDTFKDIIISLYQSLENEKKIHETSDLQFTNHLFAANWLGYKVEDPFIQRFIEKNDVQTQCLLSLQAKFTDLYFEEEQSINGLPPCDIVVHDKKIAIEVQGMHHFLDKNRTLINGTTILKNALLRKNNYHVIEVKVVDGKISDVEIEACFDKIEKILKRTQSLQKVKF